MPEPRLITLGDWPGLLARARERRAGATGRLRGAILANQQNNIMNETQTAQAPTAGPSAWALAAARAIEANHVWSRMQPQRIIERAEIIDRETHAKELAAALGDLADWFGVSKSPLDQFDDLAEQFFRETGVMRPGKDQPVLGAIHSDEERDEAWAAWITPRKHLLFQRVKTLLAKIRPAQPNKEGAQP